MKNKYVLLGWHLKTNGQNLCEDRALKISSAAFCVRVVQTSHILCFLPEEMREKCVKVMFKNDVVVMPIPNKFERD
jgi:hypothetical protein